jgi:hypothetical protein
MRRVKGTLRDLDPTLLRIKACARQASDWKQQGRACPDLKKMECTSFWSSREEGAIVGLWLPPQWMGRMLPANLCQSIPTMQDIGAREVSAQCRAHCTPANP